MFAVLPALNHSAVSPEEPLLGYTQLKTQVRTASTPRHSKPAASHRFFYLLIPYKPKYMPLVPTKTAVPHGLVVQAGARIEQEQLVGLLFSLRR